MSATKVKNSHNKNTNSNTPFNFRPIALAIALAFNGSIVGTANAATYIVNNTNDSGAGSLRQAIIDANNSSNEDRIEIVTPPGSIININTTLKITQTVTITGRPNVENIIIDGGGNTSILLIQAPFEVDNPTITLENLTLQNGFNSSNGGGIGASYVDLIVNNSSIINNSTNRSGGGINQYGGELTLNNTIISNNSTDVVGGGITFAGGGTFNLNKSTVSGNTALGGGGGIWSSYSTFNANQSTISNNKATGSYKNGGGISHTNGSIAIFQSTISGNSASSDGGGIFLESSGQTNYITQSTITNNSAFDFARGAGISFDNPNANNGILTINNSIISGNELASSNKDIKINTGTGSIVVNSRYSLLGDDDSFINGSNINTIFTDDPALGPLSNNGGATLTHLPRANSPAIDTGDGAALLFFSVDQRGDGYPRFNPDSAGVDIGATELQANDSIFSYDIDDDGTIAPLTDGLLVLRYLFGFRGASLIDNAIGSGATRNTASDIESYLQTAVDNERLDIDGNNEIKPLTDGLLVLRYQFGFRGDSLIQNAIGTGATRNTAASIESFLQ